MSYGPSLPPHLQKKKAESSDEEEETEQQVVGPALPPRTSKKRKSSEDVDADSALGPKLPPGFCKKSRRESEEDDDSSPLLGPALPPGMKKGEEKEQVEEEEDDEGMIGPLPPQPGGSGDGLTSQDVAAKDFEARSQRMRDRIEGKDKPAEPKRESWMTVLPPEMTKNFGLGPRQFSRSKAEPKNKDRSMWTDTPEMKAKRARGEEVPEESTSKDPSQDKDVLDYLASLKRDEEMERISEDLREKRGKESLMEKHEKKMRKKAKKEAKKAAEAPKERRAFDRDVDLQANHFDEARKKAMLKKSQQLDNRFSRGASKFL